MPLDPARARRYVLSAALALSALAAAVAAGAYLTGTLTHRSAPTLLLARLAILAGAGALAAWLGLVLIAPRRHPAPEPDPALDDAVEVLRWVILADRLDRHQRTRTPGTRPSSRPYRGRVARVGAR